MAVTKVTHAPSLEGQERIAAALEHIAQVEAAAAAGNAAPEFIDATFGALLDGTNTTNVFCAWWPLSAAGEQDRYRRLERFARMAAWAWRGKTYTVRGYSAETSGESRMEPLDDLAALGPAALATDTAPGGADWAEEDPMTWYVRANAVSRADGTADIKAIEGVDDAFDITGELAPVYTFALALWRREVRDASYITKSWRTTQAAGFRPYAGDVGLDGKKRALTWHATFGGSFNKEGKLTSGAGGKPAIDTSAYTGLTAARMWSQYEGLFTDCDVEWLLEMGQLRHQSKGNSGMLEGCTRYSYKYQVAAAEENVSRVLLTDAQEKTLIEGSTVAVGTSEGGTSLYNPAMRAIANNVRILSIASVTVDGTEYKAINLDMEPKTIPATAMISTLGWYHGSTEVVPGHKDGCRGSLTNGLYPLRVAGVEAVDGCHAIGLDPLYRLTAGTGSGRNTYEVFTCMDGSKQAKDITEDYKETGITFTDLPYGWSYVKEFVPNTLGIRFPLQLGGSSTSYYRAGFYGSSGVGVRNPWKFGYFEDGDPAGLAAGTGCNGTETSQYFGAPRLSGAAKTRGEWEGDKP